MVLTYDKIREFQYRERENSMLQNIPESFFSEVSVYMKGDDAVIKQAINDLIARRQAKIVNMALMGINSGQQSKPKNLTEAEERFFDEISNSLKKFRSDVFDGNFSECADEQKSDAKPAKEQDGFVLIKENLPSFIGTDMKTYRLKKGDKVYLPDDLRNLLLKNNVCIEAV